MNNEIEIKIKTCKVCGSTENKFIPTRYTCIKCLNKKYRKPEYFKNYYETNKDLMCENAKKIYNLKKQQKLLI